MSEEALKLSGLATGEKATITRVAGGAAMTRLREFGLLPGTRVTLVRRAPLGDPLEFSVRGTLLSIRRSEAEQIDITRDA